jgi:hypothetical protein
MDFQSPSSSPQKPGVDNARVMMARKIVMRIAVIFMVPPE